MLMRRRSLSALLRARGFLRDEQGAVAIYMMITLPVFVGLLGLGTDGAYGLYMRGMLQATAESAALAATSELPKKADSTATAKRYVEINMPAASFGQVLRDQDVVLGRWTDPGSGGCTDDATCFKPAVGATGDDCTYAGGQCNAVRVTTQRAASNGNPVGLTFGRFFGGTTMDVGATAIAVFGRGRGTPTWDMAVVQDISGSFTRVDVTTRVCVRTDRRGNCTRWQNQTVETDGVLPQAKAANQALLDCMKQYASPGSRFGITIHTGTASVYQAPIAVIDSDHPDSNTNFNTLKDKISKIPQCATSGNTTPLCSTGTGIDAGIKSTRLTYAGLPAPPSGAQRAMIIVSDGQPNRCNGSSCSSSQARTATQNAADAAWAAGISVYTICYQADGNCTNDAANWMKTLVRGDGIALQAPSPDQLTQAMQHVCSNGMRHRLVW
jgi:Flp pilus assembly protein TadG